MKYSVIALLDDESSRFFRELTAGCLVDESRANEYVPRIAISVYNTSPDLAELTAWTRLVAEETTAFSVSYGALGTWGGGGVIALPIYSRELWFLHKQHHQRSDELCSDFTSLRKAAWMPHTEVYYASKPTAKLVFAYVWDAFKPFDAQITSLRISEYDGSRFSVVTDFKLHSSDR